MSLGIPIKSTLDNATTIQYAGLISQLADKACSVVRELDPTNDLTFFRIRTKKHEIMVRKKLICIVQFKYLMCVNCFSTLGCPRQRIHADCCSEPIRLVNCTLNSFFFNTHLLLVAFLIKTLSHRF